MGLAGGGKLVDVGRDQMMRHDVADLAKPKFRQLREDLAFVGNRRRQDHVEGGNAIAGDQQQFVAEIVDVAHFAAAEKSQSRKSGFAHLRSFSRKVFHR